MPAVSDDSAGVKLVSFCSGNVDLSIHTRNAMTLLFNHKTDEALGSQNGALPPFQEPPRAPSPSRTQEVTRDPRDRRAGALTCRSDALLRARLRENPRLGSHAQKATIFTMKHGSVAMSAENLGRGADVVVTATSSTEPVLKGAWL